MLFENQDIIPKREKVPVSTLVDRLKETIKIDLEPCTSEEHAEKKYVVEADLHRPGLALSGYVDLFTYQRIQIIGNTECRFLRNLSESEMMSSFEQLVSFDIPVIFLTDNNNLPEKVLKLADQHKIPVYRTDIETTKFMYQLRDFLEDLFAVQTMLHGTMVDVYGIGILIAGKSGIGKSEVALDLVERGHRLVSDDVVILTKKNNILLASATEMNKHFMEIRGLGVVDVMSMFGIRSIRYQKRLEVVLELSLWENADKVDRTGLNNDTIGILGTNIPLIHLPITAGKNITVIAEVIAMNYLLKHYGYDAAKAFQKKVKKHISEKKNRSDMPKRAIEYFEGDFE
ncbi:HPr(Ser) kinase/phosphatase [Rhodohalobacter barkolensis]|uniref:HPr kinase/phosphorylase n=1 Tax=Rhodohalobacter barkolensis TaxID=2053187 RepID=A0A2N0VKP9_9BACT|nr:HPr(Ser) kinase/phosphatase [Rhodohalobacter barkolensis]PKD44752.1 HPr kinase/phosphorylase [Rhodohalobacter barkolensis]